MKRLFFLSFITLFGNNYLYSQQMKINQSQQIKDLMEVKKEFGQQANTDS